MNAKIKKAAEAPAFARPETDDNYGSEGIDTRTYLAAKAMAALITTSLTSAHEVGKATGHNANQIIARSAVEFADALIAELAASGNE